MKVFINPDSTAWMGRAACRGSGLEFVDVRTQGDLEQLLALCDSCPVIMECAKFALTTNSEGVWGGRLIAAKSAQGGRSPQQGPHRVLCRAKHCAMYLRSGEGRYCALHSDLDEQKTSRERHPKRRRCHLRWCQRGVDEGETYCPGHIKDPDAILSSNAKCIFPGCQTQLRTNGSDKCSRHRRLCPVDDCGRRLMAAEYTMCATEKLTPGEHYAA